jgi:SpoVK/Ycf46/Vps4 family AAA+-type ATPase
MSKRNTCVLQRAITAAAASSSKFPASSTLSRLTSIFTTQNVVIFFSFLTLGNSALKYLKDWITSWLMRKFFIAKTIRAGSDNKVIVKTYIKSICRDELGVIRIRGEDEIHKVTEAKKTEEDVLVYDKDRFDIKVSHLPPIISKFVHSTAKAMFFHVSDPKDHFKLQENKLSASSNYSNYSIFSISSNLKKYIKNKLQNASQYILVVRSQDSIVSLFVPLMIRNALRDLWKKTIQRWLIQYLTIETYNNLANILTGGGKKEKDTNKITLYALRSSAKLLRLFFQEAERFNRESQTKALYIRDMLYGQNFKAQPRPMSTIAIEPGSGLDLLKQDVEIFWTQRKKLEKNDLPFQRVHLLHGPPGNGKSSILQALAIQYEIPYFYLDANAAGTADVLKALLTKYTTSERCLVVIEDAESAMPKSERYVDGSSGYTADVDRKKKDNNTSKDTTNDDDGDEDDDESEKISVKEFIELINGSQSPRPAGRLICLTTNTLDAIPAEVLRLVNSQGNLFEFPNAGKETMKQYWKNYFQSDSWWDEFIVHYTTIWCQEIDEKTNEPKRLHSAADLQKYCMRFRGRPEEACMFKNVQTFAPSQSLSLSATPVATPVATPICTPISSPLRSSNLKGYPFTTNTTPSETPSTTPKTKEENDSATTASTSLPLPTIRQGSHTFAKQHNIPLHEATEILDKYDRQWDVASKALKAQQIKVFETNRIAIVSPLFNNDIRLGMTTFISLTLMLIGYFCHNLLRNLIDKKTMTFVLLLLPSFSSIMSFYEEYEKRNTIHFQLEAEALIGRALLKWFSRRIAHLSCKFEINKLQASHLRQGPLESNAKQFEHVVSILPKDGAQAFCVSTKDKTASITPKLFNDKWIDLNITMPPSSPSLSSLSTLKKSIVFPIQFAIMPAKKTILHTESHAERQLRKYQRNYTRQDRIITRSLKVIVKRDKDTKSKMQQLLQMAMEEHAQDTLDQAIKVIHPRIISGKLEHPRDEYYQHAEIFLSSGISSEIKRLEDHSFHWPIDDNSFNSSLEHLLQDAIRFDQSKEFYTLRGIPYRRSYLLSGASATGKNYFIRYLAHKLGREICILDFSKLTHRLIGNAGLAMAVNSIGSNGILVMRHLDSLVSASEGNAGRSSGSARIVRHGRHGRRIKSVTKSLTYSGILNVLDGPCAHNNGLITIMTTHRFDKLMEDNRTSTALLRPGRCAMHVKFQNPTEIQIFGLFHTMFSSNDNEINNKEEIIKIDKIANEFVQILKKEENIYWKRYQKLKDIDKKVEKEERNEEKKDETTGETKDSKYIQYHSRCWKSVVDWDSIKGYLRPLLHVGHESAATLINVKKFLIQSFLTKRQQLKQQLEEELEKLDSALLLNPKRTDNIEIRKSASFDAQFVLNQIISPVTGWAHVNDIDDDDLCHKIRQIEKKIKLLNEDQVSNDLTLIPCCPKGHPLKIVIDIYSRAICDGTKFNGEKCGVRLRRGTSKFSCKKNGCDYDVCKSCFEKEKKKLKKLETKTTVETGDVDDDIVTEKVVSKSRSGDEIAKKRKGKLMKLMKLKNRKNDQSFAPETPPSLSRSSAANKIKQSQLSLISNISNDVKKKHEEEEEEEEEDNDEDEKEKKKKKKKKKNDQINENQINDEKKDNNHINIKPFQVSPLFASVPLRGHVGPIPFGLMGVTSNEKREKEEKMYQMIEEVHSFISKQTIKKD